MVHIRMAAFGRSPAVVVDTSPVPVGDAVADEHNAPSVLWSLGAGNGRQRGQDKGQAELLPGIEEEWHVDNERHDADHDERAEGSGAHGKKRVSGRQGYALSCSCRAG